MKKKLLFICSGNISRSPAAEGLFSDSALYETTSAGVSPNAARKISQDLIDWADKIFVMSEKEDGHLSFLRENFDITGKEIYNLEISNKYQRDDPELTALLKARLAQYISG